MRIGLYGGSFDPIHRGHVEPVLEARRSLSLDEVIYLPTANPPHKPDRRMAPATSRFVMAELALLDHPELRASDFEMDRQPAYTIDTVAHFRASRPDDELLLIVGADSFVQLETWHRGSELAESVDLVVLARPGWRLQDQNLPAPQARAVERGRVQVVKGTQIDVSSTKIRRRLEAGELPTADWLDPRVLSYLLKYRLYAD